MCFKPKVNVPKVDAQAIVPPPAPLLEDPAGVKFGGSDEAYERTEGTKQGRIDLDEEEKEEAKNTKKPKPRTTNVAANRRARSIGQAVVKNSSR